MLWKVFLVTFSVSAASFLVWAMVTSRLASDPQPQPEPQPQPLPHKRYLQVNTVQTRNITLFHRTGVTRTTKALQREFRSMTICVTMPSIYNLLLLARSPVPEAAEPVRC